MACCGLLLLLPAIAMRFTDEVAWDGTDFAIFGAMLFGGCGAYELVAGLTARQRYRAVAACVVVVSLLLIWAHLAVGLLD